MPCTTVAQTQIATIGVRVANLSKHQIIYEVHYNTQRHREEQPCQKEKPLLTLGRSPTLVVRARNNCAYSVGLLLCEFRQSSVLLRFSLDTVERRYLELKLSLNLLDQGGRAGKVRSQQFDAIRNRGLDGSAFCPSRTTPDQTREDRRTQAETSREQTHNDLNAHAFRASFQRGSEILVLAESRHPRGSSLTRATLRLPDGPAPAQPSTGRPGRVIGGSPTAAPVCSQTA